MPPRTLDQLSDYVAEREKQREARFLSGLPSRDDLPTTARGYCVFCFVSGVSLGTRMRFDRWEILPFRGLDGTDLVEAINEFLETRTSIRARFEYTVEVRSRARSENPICVAHFPFVLTPSDHEAARFCVEKTSLLTEVLSFYRHAAGSVFAAVTLDRATGECRLFTRPQPYRGNLLTGPVAGEDPETVRFLVESLQSDPQLRYFMSLYKMAQAETNVSYVYLRYWQLLETVAESKNYDPRSILTDQAGIPLLNKKGKPRTSSGAVGIVYRLVFESLGAAVVTFPGNPAAEAYGLIDYVESWAAMRNATAHFGGFSPDDPIQESHFSGYDKCRKVVSDQGGLDGFILSRLLHQADLIIGGEIQERLDRTWAVYRGALLG